MTGPCAEDQITRFGLKPHPFDGWFGTVETERVAPVRFHYLIQAGEYAAWHRTAGQIIMTHIDGAPLTVTTSYDGHEASNRVLGDSTGSAIQIDAGAWRTWESLGHWSLLLVSTDDPAHFMSWDLAPDDWFPH